MKLLPTYLKTILYAIVVCLSMLWVEAGKCAEGIENPVLNWKIGDHWTVQAWLAAVYRSSRTNIFIRKGQPIFVQFEVSGISTSSYGQCYVVNVVYPRSEYGTQDGYLLYYACTNGRLVAIRDNTERRNGTRSNTRFNYSAAENMPVLTKNVFSAVPFDQPLFSEAGTNLVVQEEDREIRQQIVFDENGKGFTTIITVKSKYEEERRIDQKWEPELPWWKELKEYKNGELINEPEFILEAQVTLKPEALEVSPGILTAFVRLPDGYPVSGITSATCDGAPAERMIHSEASERVPNEDGTEMIIKFRRKDIEAALARIGERLDTHFVVRGTWQGAAGTSVSFQGTDSITKIVGAKGANLSRSGRE